MSLISFTHDQNSVLLRVKILNSSVATGAGLTGLTFSSAGLIISTIADNEATAIAYTQAGSTVETITTLGTYAAPTATKCRFKEVDATNHPGVYEIQFADARFGVASAKSLLISVTGASNVADTDALIPLVQTDPYDSVRGGVTALPNAAAEAAGGLYTRGSGAGQINQSANGQVDSNVERLGNVVQSLTDLKDFADAGYDPVTNKVQGVVLTDTTTDLTNLPSIPTNWLTAAGIAAGALDGKGNWNIGKTGYALTTAGILAIWHQLTSAIVTASTIGKLLKDNVNATVSSRMAEASINTTGGAVNTVTTLTNKTGFSLAATGLDAIVSTAIGMVEIAKAVWDRLLTGATHNITNSAGKRVRGIAGFILREGVAQAGSSITITLDAGASAIDDFYKHMRIVIIGGTGVQQQRIILSYVGSTKVATISLRWVTNPDATTEFQVVPGMTHSAGTNIDLIVGHAAAGTATTITLNGNASAIDNFYLNQTISIHDGTGKGQARMVSAYVGATKVLTVHRVWDTTPDTTSEYVITAVVEVGPSGSALTDLASAAVCTEARLSELDEATAGKMANQVDLVKTEADKIALVDAGAGAAGSVIEEIENRSTPADVTARSGAIQKNVDFSNFQFLMVLTSDHVTPATGKTVTCERLLDGGTFVAVAGTIAEVSDGFYQFDALAADTNGDTVTWKFSAADCDDQSVTFNTVPG